MVGLVRGCGVHNPGVASGVGSRSPRFQAGGAALFERGAIHRLKDALARAGELLEGAAVEILQEGADGAIDPRQAEEVLMTQTGQDPALGQEDPGLDLGASRPGLRTRAGRTARPQWAANSW